MRGILAILLASGFILISGTNLLAYGSFEGKEKMRERMEILRMWKMMEALDLDQDAANKMMQIRRGFLRKRRELRKDIGQDFDELRKIVKSPAETGEDTKLRTLLDGIRQKRAKLKKLWEEQYDEVSKVLTLRQQAQLIVFLKDFHREFREALRGFRHGPPRGRGRMRHKGPNRPFMDQGGRQPGRGPGSPQGPLPEPESEAFQPEI